MSKDKVYEWDKEEEEYHKLEDEFAKYDENSLEKLMEELKEEKENGK